MVIVYLATRVSSAFDEIRAPHVVDIKYLMKSSLCFLHQPVVLTTDHHGEQRSHQQGYQQHGYGYHHQGQAEAKEEESEGFLGILKRWFGGGKSKDESKGPGEHMMANHLWHYIN